MATIVIEGTDTFLEWRDKCNSAFAITGDLDTLDAGVEISVVDGINTVNAKVDVNLSSIGTIGDLGIGSDLVIGINSVDAKADTNAADITDLDTYTGYTAIPVLDSPSDGESLAAAINRLRNDFVTLEGSDIVDVRAYIGIDEAGGLTTPVDTNLTLAVNSVDDLLDSSIIRIDTAETNISTADTEIGDLSSLSTTAQDSLVNAVNEVVSLTVAKTSSTGSAILPVGSNAQRDGSPVNGYMRYNSDNSLLEYYDGAEWVEVGPRGLSATGGNGENVFYENDIIIQEDYTITTDKNAMTAGPVEIQGATITIPAGSTWTVV